MSLLNIGMPTYVVTAYGTDATFGEIRVISVARSVEDAMRDASVWARRHLGYTIKRRSWEEERREEGGWSYARWSYDYPKATGDLWQENDMWCQFRIVWTPLFVGPQRGSSDNPEVK